MIVTDLYELCGYKRRARFRLHWGYIETTCIATVRYVWKHCAMCDNSVLRMATVCYVWQQCAMYECFIGIIYDKIGVA